MAFHPGRDLPDSGIFSGRCRRKSGCVSIALLWCCLGSAGPVLGSPAAAGAVTAVGAAAAATAQDTLVVRASALPAPVAPAAAGLVTRIDLADETGGRDLADLLGQGAGFQVRRYGGLGAYSIPSLRGSSPAQIRFFIDGMPVDNAQSGLVDLTRLPLERFATAEIHRGVVPAGLSGIGGAGAVNLVTRQEDEGTDVRVFAGSFGDLGGRASWGATGGEGRRSALVMVHGRTANNDFTYLDNHRTFHETGDDTLRTRENAWFQEYGAWGSGRLTTGKWDHRVALGYYRRDGGLPAPLGQPDTGAAVRHATVDGRLSSALAGDQLRLDLAAARSEEYLYDHAGEVGFDPAGTTHALSHDLTGRVSWQPRLLTAPDALLSGLQAQLGMERRGQWVRHRLNEAQQPRRNRSTTSAFASLDVDLAGNRLRLVPAWRWQRNEDDFPPVPGLPWLPEQDAVKNIRDDVSPSLGMLWSVVAARLFLEAHHARTVRVPTWTELFGYLGYIQGNRELQPEEVVSTDLALTWRPGSGWITLRGAVFLAETEQTILYIQNSQTTNMAVNLGRSRTRGVEIETSALLPAKVLLAGNLTVQSARDRGPDPAYYDKELPYLPAIEAWLRSSREFGSWQPFVELSWEGANYRDRANTELNKAPAREILNVGLTGTWYPRWLGPAGTLAVTGEIINVTDNSVYDVEGYPLPGRTWNLAVRVRH